MKKLKNSTSYAYLIFVSYGQFSQLSLETAIIIRTATTPTTPAITPTESDKKTAKID